MKESQKKAVALKYKHGEDRAPRLVAKGFGKVAEKIIEVAKAHGIHIKKDDSLIEVLSTLDIYQEIPVELYKAVAEILVFVYSLDKKAL